MQLPFAGDVQPEQKSDEYCSKWGAFDDVDGYCAVRVSADSLTQLYMDMTEYNVPWMAKLARMVGGRFWRGDHNFKYTMKLRCPGGGKNQYSAVFTIMNEYGEVVDQQVVESKELLELEPYLEDLQQRLEQLGLEVCYMAVTSA